MKSCWFVLGKSIGKIPEGAMGLREGLAGCKEQITKEERRVEGPWAGTKGARFVLHWPLSSLTLVHCGYCHKMLWAFRGIEDFNIWFLESGEHRASGCSTVSFCDYEVWAVLWTGIQQTHPEVDAETNVLHPEWHSWATACVTSISY